MRGGSERGLTLIEVLVALAIFAVVSVAVLATFPAIFKLNGQTRADQAVTVGAKGFMEGVRVRYSTQAGFDTGTLPPVPSGAGYTCTGAVANQLGTSPVLIKRVTLSCTHPSQPTQTFVLDVGRPA
ncbi:PulJ/GspJ family protein [Deinococcus planocerae]|uniref:PulJ/GspJ family protein n=1 Tax=Deinococcus planocerae TaxID=1737569 RepID=UPI0015E0AC6B|nr:prepilin-type N-terminal cleavage/methylation domain-containing protein [Deinococcus planocerae]